MLQQRPLRNLHDDGGVVQLSIPGPSELQNLSTSLQNSSTQPHTPPLLSLSLDLMLEILDFLDISSRNRLRLACKALDIIIGRYITPQVVIFKTERDLLNLRDIASHERYAKQIHELVYIPESLEPKIADEGRLKALYLGSARTACPWLYSATQISRIKQLNFRGVQHILEPRHTSDRFSISDLPAQGTPTDEEVKLLWEQYRRLAQEQHDITLARHDTAALREALQKLPRLRALEILCDEGFGVLGPNYRQSLALEFCKDVRPSIRVPWEPLNFASVRPWYWGLDGNMYSLYDSLSGLIEYRRAVDTPSAPRLERIKVGWIRFQFLEDSDSPDDMSGAPGQAIPHLFGLSCANLTVVALYISTATDMILDLQSSGPRSCSQSTRKGHIRRFLRALPLLRELCVKFDSISWSGAFPARLVDIIAPNHVWPHLETLTLDRIEAPGKELTTAINLQPSLQFVRLLGLRIPDVTDKEFAASLQVGPRCLVHNVNWPPTWAVHLNGTELRHRTEYRDTEGKWQKLREEEFRPNLRGSGGNTLRLEEWFPNTW
ncbi:hypothetical protein QBC34DRAFT_462484 [Podospora aff. communis PSN243]|uniref:F-box domain-containing protein n=1 Tax=Podospora aff. communis PSN243 TaxID=3040156 RepID=A0AAV9GN13_9PEZI|nr:hypothetical protein QBC34DRAFT_462484 [Podospora aff. communis PSN243]